MSNQYRWGACNIQNEASLRSKKRKEKKRRVYLDSSKSSLASPKIALGSSVESIFDSLEKMDYSTQLFYFIYLNMWKKMGNPTRPETYSLNDS